MPVPMTQSQAKLVSTEANPKYLWSSFCGESHDAILGSWIDPLTVDMIFLLESTKNMTPVPITSNTSITMLSQSMYGTTSMWAIILYLNGFMHPDEIPSGYVLLLPSLDAIDTIKASANKVVSNFGQNFVV